MMCEFHMTLKPSAPLIITVLIEHCKASKCIQQQPPLQGEVQGSGICLMLTHSPKCQEQFVQTLPKGGTNWCFFSEIRCLQGLKH